jgi:hypothetical protein
VIVFDTLGTLSANSSPVTGLAKELTIQFLPTEAVDIDLLLSDSKQLELQYVSSTEYNIRYDGSVIGNFSGGGWQSVTLDVDVGATLVLGGAGSFEVSYLTLEDNGSWEGKSYNDTDQTMYNLDQATATNVNFDFWFNVESKQYPANSALTATVIPSLSIRSEGGMVHNGGLHAVSQDVGSVALLATPFWSADGIVYDDKYFTDFLPHVSYDGNVALKYSAGCDVSDAVTFDELTGDEYDNMVTWQGATSCGAGNLEPLEDVGGEWILDVNGDVIFPAI